MLKTARRQDGSTSRASEAKEHSEEDKETAAKELGPVVAPAKGKAKGWPKAEAPTTGRIFAMSAETTLGTTKSEGALMRDAREGHGWRSKGRVDG